MLNEYQLEALPSRISYRLQSLNTLILENIGQRLKEIGELKPSDVHKLRQLKDFGADIDEITLELSRISNKNISEIYEIYEIAAQDAYNSMEPLYKDSAKPFIPYEDNKHLQQYVKALAKQTAETYVNMSQTTGFMIFNSEKKKVFTHLSGVYQEVVDEAVTAVSTGVKDYQSAIRSTIRNLADSGLRTKYRPLDGAAGKVVDYATGYSRRLDTAVRQNILWGVKQCNQNISNQIGEEFGADGYEISYHSNPRPSHAHMGGRMYAKGTGKTVKGQYYPSIREVEDLLSDYNCYHIKFPVILGVSQPAYSKKELAKLEEDDLKAFEYEGKTYTKYEASQVQRKLETAIRHAKDRQIIAKATGDDTLRRMEQEKINALARQYAKFSKAADLPTKMERASVSRYNKVKTQSELRFGVNNSKIKEIRLPDGSYSKLTEDTVMEDVEVFAGKNSNRELRVKYHLAENYGGKASNWQHSKGRGYVDDADGTSRKAMLHWFEEESVGIFEMSVKGWSKK